LTDRLAPRRDHTPNSTSTSTEGGGESKGPGSAGFTIDLHADRPTRH
jgi:hypothetical protein